MIEVLRLFVISFKEPLLNRCQWNLSHDTPLFCFNHFIGACDRCQFCNALALEQLLRYESETRLIGFRDNLKAQNRITAQFKEVVIYSYLIQPQHLSEDTNQYLLD